MRLLFIGWANHVHLARWVEYFAAAGHQTWVLPVTSGRINGARMLPFVTVKRRVSLQKLELNFYRSLLKIDLVHAHWADFGYIPYYAGSHPYVVTAWGSDVYQIDEYDAVTRERICLGLQNASLVTVDSDDLSLAVARLGVDPARIKVIQWGVDTSLFRQTAKDLALAKELGVAGRKVIYSPRNIAPVYNNDVILRALQIVLKECPETVLVQKHYNCSEQKINDYLELAQQLGVKEQVRLVGTMEYHKLPQIYSLADAVVSVPSSDATPMSVLEAMACGCYPVVSDLPSLREWIEDGENGTIVPIGNHEELSCKLIEVLSGKKHLEPVLDRNRKIVFEKADHRTNMRKMEEYYRDLIKQAN